MRAVWLGGLRYETERNAGINSLLSALVTRGTATRSADEINDAIEGMGGAISAFSGQNSFGLRAEVLARHWEQGLEILSDCILQPALANEEVERERQALLDDILAQEDNLSSVALRLFSRTLYKKHPYRLDQLGRVSSVTAISRSQLEQYYRRHYHPSGMVLAVVGDVDPEQVKARVARLFGTRKRKRAAMPRVPQEPPRESPEEAFELVNKQQAHIVVGYPGVSLSSKDRFPLEVLSQVLSGQGGRLFRELRDRQSLAYHLAAFSHEGLDPGYFGVYMATSPDRLEEALDGIEAELQKVRAREVPAAELERAKRYLVGSFEISLQRKSTVAAYLAFHERYGLGHQSYFDYPAQVLAVTAQDIRRVARTYLDPDKRVVAVVKPEELSPGAERELGRDRRAGVVRGSEGAPKKARARGRKPKGKRKRAGGSAK
jgi:zinc protease